MANLFKDNNTILIQGWMLNKFELSGNELIAYALVYGFSQDEKSTFYGSIKYVASALNCSNPTAISVLNNLVFKGVIEKEQVVLNGVVNNTYKHIDTSKVSLPLPKITKKGSKESLFGSKESLHNNNIYNNKENNKKENSVFIDFDKLVLYFNKILFKKTRVVTDTAKKNFKQRLKEGYLKEDIVKVIDNASNDNFHKESNFKHVTLEFLSRDKIFERYASMDHVKPKAKVKDGHINY